MANTESTLRSIWALKKKDFVCAICRLWDKGHCHRYPPIDLNYPPTKEYDWCGEFQIDLEQFKEDK
jgi:hypothetical protein